MILWWQAGHSLSGLGWSETLVHLTQKGEQVHVNFEPSHPYAMFTTSLLSCVCFVGDYFGILLDEKVTVFPFNIMENPMYWGSTANYLGLALM